MPLRDGEHDRRRALPADARLRARHAGEAGAALPRPVAAGDRERRASVGFALVVGGLILGISIPAGSVLPIALVVLITAASCTGLGLVIAALGLLVRETATLNNIVFGLLLVFCGANVPLDDLPGWMSTIAQGLPLTHGIEAARSLADGAALSSVWGWIGAEALVGAVYGLLGYGMIRALEGLSRRRATLERA